MRVKTFLGIGLVCAVLAACEGPEGPIGVKGEQGERGPAGERGPQGDPGKDGTNGTDGSEVVYTQWKSIPWSAAESGLYKDSLVLLRTAPMGNSWVEIPEITRGVLDSGMIVVYKRFYMGGYTPKAAEVFTQVVTNDTRVTGYFFKPGKAGWAYESLGQCTLTHSTHFTPGKLTFDANMNLKINFARPGDPDNIKIPISDLVQLYNEAIQYRVLIIKGNQLAGGRMKNIDWNNYEEVKQVLNLED